MQNLKGNSEQTAGRLIERTLWSVALHQSYCSYGSTHLENPMPAGSPCQTRAHVLQLASVLMME